MVTKLRHAVKNECLEWPKRMSDCYPSAGQYSGPENGVCCINLFEVPKKLEVGHLQFNNNL